MIERGELVVVVVVVGLSVSLSLSRLWSDVPASRRAAQREPGAAILGI